jgi:hypothetical protein
MAWWGWLVLVWLPVSVFTAGWMARAIHAAEMSEWTGRVRRIQSRAISDPREASGAGSGSSDRGGDGSSLGAAS